MALFPPLAPLASLADPRLVNIWTTEHEIQTERHLWCAIMALQQLHGVAIPLEAINASVAAVDQVDTTTVQRIRERERVTRHDLKARLEIFCEDAGHEYHHLGLTSADIVENVMAIRVRSSLMVLAQQGMEIDHLLSTYPFRGVKGPVGTQQDLADLIGADRVADFDRSLSQMYGFEQVLISTPQVAFRSIDFQLTSTLEVKVAHLAHPGRALLRGYCQMAAETAGATWNEGDVSTSVVRRVAIPGALMAASWIWLETNT